jgi:hypothetical protein
MSSGGYRELREAVRLFVKKTDVNGQFLAQAITHLPMVISCGLTKNEYPSLLSMMGTIDVTSLRR